MLQGQFVYFSHTLCIPLFRSLSQYKRVIVVIWTVTRFCLLACHSLIDVLLFQIDNPTFFAEISKMS